ncbi:hypothetical protein IMZ48_15735 [Candidatus Bathyarchaeota archaeon]|nr:hypothetical protein [Candidatus Bathyarchaeota archaeon]
MIAASVFDGAEYASLRGKGAGRRRPGSLDIAVARVIPELPPATAKGKGPLDRINIIAAIFARCGTNVALEDSLW